jgi:hypothetical protein
MNTRIEAYQTAGDQSVSLGGIKWQNRWDVKVTFNTAQQARDFQRDLPLIVKNAELASHAKRLALELECLLMDTKDMAAVSRWWNSAHEALEQFQADVRRLFPQEDVEAHVGAHVGSAQ